MLNHPSVLRIRRALRRHVLDAVEERGLVHGMRIEMPRPRECRLAAFEESLPGPGEVVIATLVSAVSPGTERAVYLRLENVLEGFPHVPGYSQAGRVVAAGPGARLQVGQLVASAGPHASLSLCPADRALSIPEGVSAEHAALTQIGCIAMQGVRKAAIAPGERVAVLGCGLVGQLAAQLARLAGGDVVAVATSPERLAVARACGTGQTLDSRAEPGRLDALGASVVIEATGRPDAIHDACSAAAPGARVILLGSSRGVTRDIDLGSWQGKELTLVGAHVRTVPTDGSGWTWRRECEAFLALLALGRLAIDPLITRRAAPGEAPAVYRDLARLDDKSVAVLFDWTQPGPWTARVERVSPLRVAVAGARRLLGRPAPPEPAFLPRRSDGRVLRFGLVGCGEIAAESAAALRAASNATIVFAADPDLDLARSLAAANGARAAARIEELLASPEVDAVLISTPHHLHAPLAIQAIAAGKHVVVEKPMATSVADCDRMIAEAERRGVVLSVCYCQRFDPRLQRAKRLLDAGAVGEVLSTRISFGQYRGPEYWTEGLTGRVRSDWRSRRETAGGGVLIMNACHLLDTMCWLVGSEIAEVAACAATLAQAVEVEDTVALSYRYAQGALGVLDATTSLVGPDAYEQMIFGREGQLVLAPTLRFWSRRTVEGYEAGRWHRVGPLPRAAERRQFFEAFADAVLEGRQPPVAGREARAVQAAIEAAYLSAERKQTVAVL